MKKAGLKPKLKTFKKVLTDLKPSAFVIQESKYKEEGKLKFNSYVIFSWFVQIEMVVGWFSAV